MDSTPVSRIRADFGMLLSTALSVLHSIAKESNVPLRRVTLYAGLAVCIAVYY